MSKIALKNFTTFRVGGAPDTLLVLSNAKEYLEIADSLESYRVIGGGSNLVISDKGPSDTIVVLSQKSHGLLDIEGEEVRLDAAGTWHEAVCRIGSEGLGGGVESMVGIPGSVGGAIVQNIGAYGFEISTFVKRVHVYDKVEKGERWIEGEECNFSYRDSRFKSTDRGRFVILGAVLALKKTKFHQPKYKELREKLSQVIDETPEGFPIPAVHREVLKLRSGKNMVWSADNSGTWGAGSFFVNPVVSSSVYDSISTASEVSVPSWQVAGNKVKLSAGWLVESAGFTRGYNWDRVGLAEGHALGLVNRSAEASAEDVVAAANEVAQAVQQKFGIRLMAEPVFLGFDKNTIKLHFDAHLER